MPSTDVSTHSVVLSRDGHHYFACEVTAVCTRGVLHIPDDEYAESHRRRHVDLVTCLTNPGDSRFTYDLRFVSRPDATLFTRGRIDIALLCRIDDIAAAVVGDYAREFLRLLQSFFDEYEFALATTARVASLLQPFPIASAATIRRRCAAATLDTLVKPVPLPKRVGFKATAAPPTATSPTVFHIFPFLATSDSFTSVAKLLLLQPAQTAVSFRLQPASLSLEEEEFVETQIATCERYAQTSLGTAPDDLSRIRPTLQAQARNHQTFLMRMLQGLRDNAALLTCEVASSGNLPISLLDAIGSLVTQPAGGRSPSFGDGAMNYLAGGYEVESHPDLTRIARAFESLDIALPQFTAVPRRLVSMFDSIEATAAFRLPPAETIPLPGIESRQWRIEPPPPNLPKEGVAVGTSAHDGSSEIVRIARDDRRRHMYVVGQTGTGKTTLLKSMIIDDMRAGEGLCVVDPHGDLFRDLLENIPPGRVDDVVLLDPTDVEHPVGLNMLEYEDEAQRYFLVQEMVAIITRIMEDEFGAASAQMMGPIFLQHMRMNLLLTMSNPESAGTLLEFYTIYQEKNFWRRWLPLKVSDPQLDRWVNNVLPKTDYITPTSEGASMGGYVGSKFEGFIFDPVLRNIFGQKHTTIGIRQIIEEGKILLVNLAKGELTETNSRFLGMVLLAKIQAAAMARSTIPHDQRRDFYLYVDEFQSIATQNFITLLSEARKFGLNLILANQFVSQIRDERIAQSIFGNVGSLICFRLGQRDAETMEQEMHPVFTRSDLINLPNWHAYMTTLIGGQTVQPFTIRTIARDGSHPSSAKATVRDRSRARYARPREAVAREILESTAPAAEAK